MDPPAPRDEASYAKIQLVQRTLEREVARKAPKRRSISIIAQNRERLSRDHYVQCANHDRWWTAFSPAKLEERRKRNPRAFRLVIFRDEGNVANDFYAIPYKAVAALLTKRCLSTSRIGIERWNVVINSGRFHVSNSDEPGVDVRRFHADDAWLRTALKAAGVVPRAPASQASLLPTIVPDPVDRLALANALADSIIEAHAARPATWSLTNPEDQLVRLNVGPIEAFVLQAVSPAFIVDDDSSRRRIASLGQGVTLSRAGHYSSVPGARLLHAPPAAFLRLREQLDDSHVDVLRKAAAARSRTTWRKMHSPSVLDEVEKLVGRILPRPDYRRVPAAAGDDDEAYFAAREGLVVYRRHLARERNATLVRLKKADVTARTGTLACSVCAFDFQKIYGDLGVGFAECHHAVALSTYRKSGGKTSLRDLAIVCANCHRMLHRRRPWLAVTALRDVIAAPRGV